MRRSRFTEEQILVILQEGEAGRTVDELCRQHGVAKHTYYCWKAKYGGLQLSDAKRLRHLEEENRGLKHAVAELTLEKRSRRSPDDALRTQLVRFASKRRRWGYRRLAILVWRSTEANLKRSVA